MCDVCGDARHAPGKSRRGFLRAGTLAALAPWGLDVAVAADPPKAGAAPPQNAIPPADALKRLLEGNARYAAKKIDIVGGVYDIATGKVTML